MQQNKIYPCLIFDQNAAEAAKFYADVFRDTEVTSNNSLASTIQMQGQGFLLLNGGSNFTKNASISFMVLCDSEEEVTEYWQKLTPEGKALMELNSYPWSKKYGWVQDKYGVSWQLFFGDKGDAKEKAVPTLMFTQKQNGRAREAIEFYTSIFPKSRVEGILKYKEGDHNTAGNVQHAQFDIDGFTLMIMDGGESHSFTFNEAISLVVSCETQEEIDDYWNKLSANGGMEGQCGWVRDKFGLWWQITPSSMAKLMDDPQRAKRVFDKLLTMKKLDKQELENA